MDLWIVAMAPKGFDCACGILQPGCSHGWRLLLCVTVLKKLPCTCLRYSILQAVICSRRSSLLHTYPVQSTALSTCLLFVCPYLKDTQQHEGVYHGSYCDCEACGGPGEYTADFQNLCVERQRKEALSRLSLFVVAGMWGPRPGPDLCGAHMFAPGALLSIWDQWMSQSRPESLQRSKEILGWGSLEIFLPWFLTGSTEWKRCNYTMYGNLSKSSEIRNCFQ